MKNDWNQYSEKHLQSMQTLKTIRCPECGARMDDGWISSTRDPVGWHDEPRYFSKKENVLKVGFKTKWAQAKHCPSCGAVVFRSQGFTEAREHPERFTPAYQKRVIALVIGISVGIPVLALSIFLAIMWWLGRL